MRKLFIIFCTNSFANGGILVGMILFYYLPVSNFSYNYVINFINNKNRSSFTDSDSRQWKSVLHFQFLAQLRLFSRYILLYYFNICYDLFNNIIL
jgi:hypothetical protein